MAEWNMTYDGNSPHQQKARADFQISKAANVQGENARQYTLVFKVVEEDI